MSAKSLATALYVMGKMEEMGIDLAATRGSEWQPVETVPSGSLVDIWVEEVVFGNGFRIPDVIVLDRLPGLIEWADGFNGMTRHLNLSENGQYISHWMLRPSPPKAATPHD